jgi:hypothetical protein
MTPVAFKRSIRDLQVWCSSCMVAFSGPDPIGVLIGAKRLSGTLIHKIAVHPNHRRQGHGRHLLTSLSSKLAILGPPRLVAEVPESMTPACELFRESGYVQETLLTDYVFHPVGMIREIAAQSHLVIPVTVDDLVANGLLGEDQPQVCWERSVETLAARRDDIAGLAVASDERIEAYVLYAAHAPSRGPHEAPRASRDGTAEILSLRCFIEDDGVRLKQLLFRLGAQGISAFRFPKVHPSEITMELLEALGLRPAGTHRLFSARARSA